MEFEEEQLKLPTKKERKELKRRQKQDAIKEFYRLRKIQKIVFWAILMIIIFGGLYIFMALIGYAYASVFNFLRNAQETIISSDLLRLAKKTHL